jgi:hypothetical protein
MGGFGSGRRLQSKNTTNDFRRLDVRKLQRDGLLKSGRTCSWKWEHDDETTETVKLQTEIDLLTLTHQYKLGNDDWKEKRFSIFLDWTSCNYGGKRVWFICSHSGCWRRVAILYGGATFACRHCYKLAYPCQRETTLDRATRRAEKIRSRLGWEEGFFSLPSGKPKGMHWNTFERLTHQHNVLFKTSLDGIKKQLGLKDED